LLGLGGSLLGAGTGIWVAYQLVGIFSRTGNLLVDLSEAPAAAEVVAGSLAAGLLTTILFALWASLSASQVSPNSLLRGETADRLNRAWWQKGLLPTVYWSGAALLGAVQRHPGIGLAGIRVLVFALGVRMSDLPLLTRWFHSNDKWERSLHNHRYKSAILHLPDLHAPR
jgi:hypothetical protein